MLNKVQNVARRVGFFMAFAIVTCLSAFATGETTTASAETVMSGLTTGLTAAQGYMFTALTNALPLALAVAGVIIGVTIGWRIFKRMGKG